MKRKLFARNLRNQQTFLVRREAIVWPRALRSTEERGVISYDLCCFRFVYQRWWIRASWWLAKFGSAWFDGSSASCWHSCTGRHRCSGFPSYWCAPEAAGVAGKTLRHRPAAAGSASTAAPAVQLMPPLEITAQTVLKKPDCANRFQGALILREMEHLWASGVIASRGAFRCTSTLEFHFYGQKQRSCTMFGHKFLAKATRIRPHWPRAQKRASRPTQWEDAEGLEASGFRHKRNGERTRGDRRIWTGVLADPHHHAPGNRWNNRTL